MAGGLNAKVYGDGVIEISGVPSKRKGLGALRVTLAGELKLVTGTTDPVSVKSGAGCIMRIFCPDDSTGTVTVTVDGTAIVFPIGTHNEWLDFSFYSTLTITLSAGSDKLYVVYL